MIGRKIIIDSERCDGCGLCVSACHEGAIELVNGKAVLVRENVCDGLGDCLPACPQGAITLTLGEVAGSECLMAESAYQWPIQLALVPQVSEFFKGRIVIAADCTAFTLEDFRKRCIRGDAVIIGCPKLDDRARFDKILTILKNNDVESVDIVRMVVPCCSALTRIVEKAMAESGKDIRVKETVVSRSGSIVSEKDL